MRHLVVGISGATGIVDGMRVPVYRHAPVFPPAAMFITESRDRLYGGCSLAAAVAR